MLNVKEVLALKVLLGVMFYQIICFLCAFEDERGFVRTLMRSPLSGSRTEF